MAHEKRRPPRGPGKVSAEAIRIKERQSKVLRYRLSGYSYGAIAKQMHLTPSTAHRYAVKALAEVVPVEDARQVLTQELLKLDAMQAAVYQDAVSGGDKAAIDAMLKIMAMRCRLLNLYPDGKQGGVHLTIGADTAADTGIQIEFVRPTIRWDAEGREITDRKAPIINHDKFEFDPTRKGAL
jgi:hypothetical protein